MNDTHRVLMRAAELAEQYVSSLHARPVGIPVPVAKMRQALAMPLPETGQSPIEIIDSLARNADPGLVATAGPRFFGFVIGGTLPVSVAADWLATAWDQNAGLYITSPAASVVEETAANWLLELFGLPAECGVGFVTGGQMANFTCLAAARHEVLARVGWSVEDKGLQGAPSVRVVLSVEAHTTIHVSLAYLGLGRNNVTTVPADDQGRMVSGELDRTLAEYDGPTIVCAQAGHINSGAFDQMEEITRICRSHSAWLHIDGAFGLWAAATPKLRHYLTGYEKADSWAVDAHKWLNVPYDSGIAIVANADAHRGAMSATASYLVKAENKERDELDWTPEFSRRARGFPIYAALLSLGKRGVADLIERNCRFAKLMAKLLQDDPHIEILNDVVLNQVAFSIKSQRANDLQTLTNNVIARIRRDGTLWLGGAKWRDRPIIRISISGWSTSEADIRQSATVIRQAVKNIVLRSQS